MKFISHRGNQVGPNPERENSPVYVDEALAAGFEVEVDLRLVGDQFWFGHDYPQYLVNESWLWERHPRLLLHLKDTHALNYILSACSAWHYFCHSNDRFTFTSQGHIWLHDLSLSPTPRTIIPLISRELVISYKNRDIYAICSDYVVW